MNRHWDEVDLWRKEFLQGMPEIWYVKKAILACMDSERKIDLMLNLHNTETAEYIDTQVSDEPIRRLMERFFEALVARTSFEPSRKLRFNDTPGNTTNHLWNERRVPVMLMEQRIGTSSKLGRRPTVQDRLAFGSQLITVMAETVTTGE